MNNVIPVLEHHIYYYFIDVFVKFLQYTFGHKKQKKANKKSLKIVVIGSFLLRIQFC